MPRTPATTHSPAAVRVAFGVCALLLAFTAAGCSGASRTLRARSAVTAGAAQIVAASSTAALTGRRVTLMVPSGRVDLVLTAPRPTVAAQDVQRAAPLQAARGHALVGVSWFLQRAGFADSPNRQLVEPRVVFGAPASVTLTLVTDGTAHPIPGVGDLASPGKRPSTAVWLSVPTGVRSWQFALDFDRVTQTVDARSGTVRSGVAAPLYGALPLEQEGSCDLAGPYVASCLTHYAAGYPYVAGAGWAPVGKTWLLLQISLGGDFHGARQGVTVAGLAPRKEIGSNGDVYSPFLVATAAGSYAVRGVASGQNYDGTDVRARVTAQLHGNAS